MNALGLFIYYSAWAEQLKKEYEKIAKENQATSTGGVKPQLSTMLDEADKIRTDEAVANDLDMGKTTYRKAKYIYENGNEEIIKQLDDGQLSINKAYITLKKEKQLLEDKTKQILKYLLETNLRQRGIYNGNHKN